MKNKTDKKKRHLKKPLIIAIIIQAILQSGSNIACAWFCLRDEPIEMALLIFVILVGTLLRTVDKMGYYELGDIRVLAYFEFVLSCLVIISYIFIGSNDHLVSIHSLSAKKIMQCIYLSIGIFGSNIIVGLLQKAIAKELARDFPIDQQNNEKQVQ